MRSPLHIPERELNRVITKAVEEYTREVQRLRLRHAIIEVCQTKGLPVPEGEEMEALIDVGQQYVTRMEARLQERALRGGKSYTAMRKRARWREKKRPSR